MKSKYDYDIIRDYLHGLVDQETARRIRELIRNDDIARNIASGILQLEHEFNGNEDEIEAYMEGLRQKQLKLIRKNPSYGWIKMAAGILLVALIGGVVWLQSSDLVDDELSEPYPLSVNRSASDNEAQELYINGDYKRAISAFGKDDTFYKGLSHLYIGEYDEAINLLASEAVEASRYREQAQWYRALALIKAGRPDDAKKILEQIANDSSHYKSRTALDLLDRY